MSPLHNKWVMIMRLLGNRVLRQPQDERERESKVKLATVYPCLRVVLMQDNIPPATSLVNKPIFS